MQTFITKAYWLLIYLIIIFKFPITKDDQEISKIYEFYRKDIKFCPECFQSVHNNCGLLENNEIIFENNILDSINNIFGVKQINYGRSQSNNNRIVIKYLASNEKFNYILGGLTNYTKNKYESILLTNDKKIVDILQKLFLHESRINGCHFCPIGGIKSFINILSDDSNLDLLHTWLYLIVNVQTLILPILNRYNFPVPKLYGKCGFTIFESYEGLPLTYYYSSPFQLKIEIAQQLLEAAFKFSEGFLNYKLYLTDATPDNILFNEETHKISFVDLDDIIIIDSLYYERHNISTEILTKTWTNIHRHEVIECNGCFAYIPSEICSYHESDINLYVICQLLQEDLFGNANKGFLQPIPKDILAKYPTFLNILNECVTCTDGCLNRFKSARKLLEIINDVILK